MSGSTGSTGSTGSMISIDGLNKKYGATHAVRGISFEVPKGQVVGFLGPNGAGKSTTMKILTGYVEPTSGVVKVAGISVPDDPVEALAAFPEMNFEVRMLEIGRQALLVVVTFAMLLAFHLLLPARRRRLKSVAGGVFLTLVGWWIAGKVFGFYITKFANYSTTYAGLAGIVILMFFLYIQALIFLYGAEVNRSIADFRGNSLCRKGP